MTDTPQTTDADSGADTAERNSVKHQIELALLTAGQPLDIKTLRRLVVGTADKTDKADKAEVENAISELKTDWQARSLTLTETAGGYQFISKPDYMPMLRRLNAQRPPRLSRALTEILAIIAYRQPVTRGDIEQLRGIAVVASQMAFLEEQGWVEAVGRRETPGRPTLYATTKTLLDDLGLSALDELPELPALSTEESADDTPADASEDESADTDSKAAKPDNAADNE